MSGSVPDFFWQEEMGYTRRELVRGLPRAVEPFFIRDTESNPVELVLDHRMVKLYMGEEGWRTIASIRISYMLVKLEFFGFDSGQYESFLHRFLTYLQKGGG